MGASSLAVAVAFHAMRGMYLHAERLLAKAGRQGARGGVSPTRSKAEASEAKVCTSEARKTVGKPLAPRQGSALSEVWFPYCVRVSAQDYQGRRCGQEQAELFLALSEIRVFLQILRGRGKLANKGNRKRRGGYKPFLAIRD
jgi:hypothetical protein